MNPLLSVNDLHVSFVQDGKRVDAVRGISFGVSPGEFYALVGESGSGKSVTVMTAMGLLERNGCVGRGSIVYDGETLLDESMPRKAWRRPGDMAMIFQYPMVSLNPIRTIGLQLGDVLATLPDRPRGRSAIRECSLKLLRRVRIHDPERCLDSYPFELSGGMCQRVLIAMALSKKPRLLFADEPTTGLDAVTQETILKLLKDMMKENGMSVLFITHDLGLAVRHADRIGVMRHGALVEEGLPERLLRHPSTGYARRLFASTPSLMSGLDDIRRLELTDFDS